MIALQEYQARQQAEVVALQERLTSQQERRAKQHTEAIATQAEVLLQKFCDRCGWLTC